MFILIFNWRNKELICFLDLHLLFNINEAIMYKLLENKHK